jgi:hypothetical protein
MSDVMAKYVGQPLAVLCARYWYRGMVDEVGKDFITLSHVRAVEVTGPAASQTTQTEDQVPSDLTISLGAVEQFCQPFWCWANMPIKPSEQIQAAIVKAAEERKKREEEREAERKRQQEEQARASANGGSDIQETV